MHKIDLIVSKLKEEDIDLSKEVVQKVIRVYNYFKKNNANEINTTLIENTNGEIVSSRVLELFQKTSVRTQNNIKRFLKTQGFDPHDLDVLAEQIPLIKESDYMNISGIGGSSIVALRDLLNQIKS
jgi:ornithine carbamoyltransferase